MNYKFTDSANTVVAKIDDDGISRVSFLASATGSYQEEFLAWIAEGNAPNPYVPPPAPPEPTIEEKLASVGLSIDDLKTALGIK